MSKTKKAAVVAEETVVEKVKKENVALEVKVNDAHFKTKAVDLVTAFNEFVTSTDFPYSVKTKVVINYSDGKKKGSRILPVSIGRRLFSLFKIKSDAIEIFVNKLTLE